MQLSIPTPIPPNTTHLPSLKLALICGGTGAEHIGSIESALWLLSQFRPDHQPGFFYQYPDGRLAEAAELPALFETWAVHPYIKAWIDPAGAEHCRAVFRQATHWTGPAWTALTSGSWDLIWPAFHGRGGEDGSFQGFCEFLGVPYAGCGIAASVIGIDKIKTKAILQVSGLPVLPQVIIEDWELGSVDAIAAIKEHIILLPGTTRPIWGLSKLSTLSLPSGCKNPKLASIIWSLSNPPAWDLPWVLRKPEIAGL